MAGFLLWKFYNYRQKLTIFTLLATILFAFMAQGDNWMYWVSQP
jgi:hypothetical protein